MNENNRYYNWIERNCDFVANKGPSSPLLHVPIHAVRIVSWFQRKRILAVGHARVAASISTKWTNTSATTAEWVRYRPRMELDVILFPKNSSNIRIPGQFLR